jgi:hypothetical protein
MNMLPADDLNTTPLQFAIRSLSWRLSRSQANNYVCHYIWANTILKQTWIEVRIQIQNQIKGI